MRALGLAAICCGAVFIGLLGAVSFLAGDESSIPLPGIAVIGFGAMIGVGVILIVADTIWCKFVRPKTPRYSASPYETGGAPRARAKHWPQQWPPPKWRL